MTKIEADILAEKIRKAPLRLKVVAVRAVTVNRALSYAVDVVDPEQPHDIVTITEPELWNRMLEGKR